MPLQALQYSSVAWVALQRQQEVGTLQRRAADLEGSNKQMAERMEQQEATMSEQLANLQDRAQQVPSHTTHSTPSPMIRQQSRSQ